MQSSSQLSYPNQSYFVQRKTEERRNKRILEKQNEDSHILIIDTGSGYHPTITERAWRITHRYNVKISMSGYQSQEAPQQCDVVNAVTKVTIPGRQDPLIFEVNYATLVKDNLELESLVVQFEMMKHGIQVDMTPTKYGGQGSIMVEGEELHYNFDDKKLFWAINKPMQDELDTLRWVELNQPKMQGDERKPSWNHRYHGRNGESDWLCCRKTS